MRIYTRELIADIESLLSDRPMATCLIKEQLYLLKNYILTSSQALSVLKRMDYYGRVTKSDLSVCNNSMWEISK